MKLRCPYCGVKGTAEDSYSGRRVKCPKCQGLFEAEADSAFHLPEEAAPVSAPSSIAALSGPHDDELEAALATLDGPFGIDSAEPAIAAGSETPPAPDDQLTATAAETTPGSAPEEALDWEDIASEIDLQPAGADAEAGEDEVLEPAPAEEIELEPYGISKEQCWQCGRSDNMGEPFIARDGRLYCAHCVPVEQAEPAVDTGHSVSAAPAAAEPEGKPSGTGEGTSEQFAQTLSIGAVIHTAWDKTSGAKAPIWAGSAIMYLVLLALVAGGALLLPAPAGDLTAYTNPSILLFQLVINVVSVLFTAGLLFMGVRKVAGDEISWKMVFTGFSCAGKIIVAAILQFVFITIGIILLVLPGIYLTVGYAMTLPLIVDKGLSPWQAMERSRKAVHRVWWRMVGLLLVMILIFIASLLPLGIGIIWTWPMFIILAGVVYRQLFGDDKKPV